VHGFVPEAQVLRRDAARAGDLIYVTGTLGDAALGLRVARGELVTEQADANVLLGRYLRPEPRIAAGYALRGLARACIDISDGLLADLGHVLDSSGVGATIAVEHLPRSSAARRALPNDWSDALTGGDDYELCFTVPAGRSAEVEALGAKLACALTRIGVVDAERGVRCKMNDGRVVQFAHGGFDHFNSAP
jgi:thiamine-monophosphate kinase